jgi:hypothetical protein
MAYQTGSATDIADLISDLFTFATGLTTTPWTQDELDTLQGTLHRGDCYVTFRWDDTVETDLGLYQSLGWTTSTAAHQMPDDSGNGDTGGVVSTGRRVTFGSAGPYTAYHFFAGEGDEPYIYVVVEVSSGVYRHFGFGNIKKFGTWTGGEFVYGHILASFALDDPDSSAHQFLLDGLASSVADMGTMHVEDLSWQDVDEKWVVFGNTARANAGQDRAGEQRGVFIGTSRCGLAYYLSTMRYTEGTALKLITPVQVWDFNQAATPDTYAFMGEMVDVGIVNMHAFTPGQEITVGTDTWMVFPWVRKRYEKDDEQESWNAGVAYKKVT